MELENVTDNIGGPGVPVEPEVALVRRRNSSVRSAADRRAGRRIAKCSLGAGSFPARSADPPPGAGTLDQPEEDESSSQVAEQLAEADVYQKYGLEEKARERLVEVIRLAPDNLTARRRLKAIYRDRRQTDDVCTEALAIARRLAGARPGSGSSG